MRRTSLHGNKILRLREHVLSKDLCRIASELRANFESTRKSYKIKSGASMAFCQLQRNGMIQEIKGDRPQAS